MYQDHSLHGCNLKHRGRSFLNTITTTLILNITKLISHNVDHCHATYKYVALATVRPSRPMKTRRPRALSSVRSDTTAQGHRLSKSRSFHGLAVQLLYNSVHYTFCPHVLSWFASRHLFSQDIRLLCNYTLVLVTEPDQRKIVPGAAYACALLAYDTCKWSCIIEKATTWTYLLQDWGVETCL